MNKYGISMGQSYTNGGVFSCFTTWGFFPHVQVPPFHSISHPHLGIPGMAAQLKTQRFVRVHLVVILRTATEPRNRVVTRFVFSVEPSKWHWINWIILNPRKTMYDRVVPGPMCIPWSWGSGRSPTGDSKIADGQCRYPVGTDIQRRIARDTLHHSRNKTGRVSISAQRIIIESSSC